MNNFASKHDYKRLCIRFISTAPSFQQDDTPNAFSFLGSSVSGNQNDIGNSPGGFHFGFSSEASSSNNTGFSLF